jgi:peptidoglycan/xylan/chitin deacetylase (PgdA/CDA1 family)/GT2 family glycosyltransferase
MNRATVVIPTFNNEQTIGSCLSSPGIQECRDATRVIVVDNGSDDATVKIARRFGVEVLYAGRPGAAAARNVGLAEASSEFIAFIDADSYANYGWLPALIKGLDTTEHFGVGGKINWNSKYQYLKEFYEVHYVRNEDCCSPRPPSYILTANAMFRRKALQDAGGFDPKSRWCEDLELGLRLSEKGATFDFVPEAIVTQDPPESYIDRFGQFYKYGYGLEALTQKYPSQLTWWSFLSYWSNLLELAKLVISKRQDFEIMLLLNRIAYLSGWTDAYLKRKAKEIFSTNHRLEVINVLSPQYDEKIVYLTIDDGPSALATRKILELLQKYSANATFFVNGDRAERHPYLIEEILSCGHDVFAHGFSHRRFDCMEYSEIYNEMEKTERILRKLRPTPTPYLVRLPFGIGWDDDFVHSALKSWNRSCKIVQWDVSLADWEISSRCPNLESVDLECKRALYNFLNCCMSGSIVLLHDCPIGVDDCLLSEVSVSILEQVLRELDRSSFKIKSLPAQCKSR